MDEKFLKLKEKIKNGRGFFDAGTACKNLGITTTVYYSAMKKNAFSELTEWELKLLEEVVRIMDERNARFENLASKVDELC